MKYLTEALNSAHKKNEFNCGADSLDHYIRFQAKQDIKRKLAACFVFSNKSGLVMGYYTLSSASIRKESLSESILKKLPAAYHDLPATLLGRLAVDKKHKGQGIGELLLIDALKRSYDVSESSVGSMSVIVDPIDENAIQFYKKYGFVLLQDSGKMFIAMKTVKELF